MLFGQSTGPRVNFVRPEQAMPGFRPQMPGTGFYSHFHPFQKVMNPMAAVRQYMPQLSSQMGPGAAPAAAPAELPAPAMTVPGATAGFGAAGFGSSFGGGGGAARGISPYHAMRSGMFPGVSANGSNVRAGAQNAGALVRMQTPGSFPGSNVPA